MKKLVPFIVALALLLIPTVVIANSANSTYIEWSWQGEKSASFFATPAGLVHAWSYDHPEHGDTHWVAKPYSKFPNATECDEGYVFMNDSWTPRGIYNNAYSQYQEPYLEIFPDLDQEYLLCKYPLD
jgi:hypothetical protein